MYIGVEVENALASYPDVTEAAVIGVPHRRLGQDVHAFLILHEGATATADELRAHARTSLTEFKIPRTIDIVTDLPRNSTGKVLKRLVRDAKGGQR